MNKINVFTITSICFSVIISGFFLGAIQTININIDILHKICNNEAIESDPIRCKTFLSKGYVIDGTKPIGWDCTNDEHSFNCEPFFKFDGLEEEIEASKITDYIISANQTIDDHNCFYKKVGDKWVFDYCEEIKI